MTALSQRGMNFNGTTSYDRTNYFETFTMSDDSLDWALAMEADRMVNSLIARKDLDSEMTVVRNEMERGETDPVRVLIQRTLAARLRLAQLRQVDDRRAYRRRARRHRSSSGVLSSILSAR